MEYGEQRALPPDPHALPSHWKLALEEELPMHWKHGGAAMLLQENP
jgi:hypothetical protein